MNILEGVDGIRFIRFEDGDVVRHQARSQRIIRAYEGFGRAQPELPLDIRDDDEEVRFFAAPITALNARPGGGKPIRRVPSIWEVEVTLPLGISCAGPPPGPSRTRP